MANGEGIAELLRGRVRGEVQVEVPLAGRTTLKVGGPAAVLVKAEGVEDLVAVAQAAATAQVGTLVVGKGSNLLVADAGWPGIVVVLGRGFRGVDVDGAVVRAGAAEPMPVLAKQVANHGLDGLAFGTAIPGTLGGAVRMNAGAHGGEMRQVLRWADAVRMDHSGRVDRFTNEQLAMAYRHTELPHDAVVTRAELELTPAGAEQIAANMAEMRQWRRDHQPINEPSCGSTFRNPPGDSAGRLIEVAGLKGFRVGGAFISHKHANFITVEPGATAADVYGVIRHTQDQVAHQHGVDLQTEVVIAGFDAVSKARTPV